MIHLPAFDVETANSIRFDELQIARCLIDKKGLRHRQRGETLLEVIRGERDGRKACSGIDVYIHVLIAIDEEVPDVDVVAIRISDIFKGTITVIDLLPGDRVIGVKHRWQPTVGVIHERGGISFLLAQVDLGALNSNPEDETGLSKEPFFICAFLERPNGRTTRSTSSWLNGISGISPLFDITEKLGSVRVGYFRAFDAIRAEEILIAHIDNLIFTQKLVLAQRVLDFRCCDRGVGVEISIEVEAGGRKISSISTGLHEAVETDPSGWKPVNLEGLGLLGFISEVLVNYSIEALIDPLDAPEGCVKLGIVRGCLAIAAEISGRVEHHCLEVIPTSEIPVFTVKKVVFAEPARKGREKGIGDNPTLNERILHSLSWEDRSDHKGLYLPRTRLQIKTVLRVTRDTLGSLDFHHSGLHVHKLDPCFDENTDKKSTGDASPRSTVLRLLARSDRASEEQQEPGKPTALE